MTEMKSPAIADLATATPVEIDTANAALDTEYYRLNGALLGSISYLHSLDDQRARYIGRGGRKTWPKSDGDTVISVRTRVANGTDWYDRDSAVRYLAKYDEAIDAMQDNRMESARLDDEYQRRPWNRYILVTGGHIHSGTRCVGGTIRPSTQLGWRPELSGKSVADAVAELGPLLCTHCFPSAPVEWTVGEAKPERCAGSGRREAQGTYRRQGMSGYGKCQECGTYQTVTQRGAIRAHKPAKA
jgi:hypothetical protein